MGIDWGRIPPLQCAWCPVNIHQEHVEHAPNCPIRGPQITPRTEPLDGVDVTDDSSGVIQRNS